MPCHWSVPADSPVVGQALSKSDIHRRCGVQVKAIRRDGKFLRFPERKMDLQARDQLLLCGGYLQLNQLQQWLAPTTQSKAVSSVQVVTLEAEDRESR